MKKIAALLLTFAIVAAACGDDDATDPASIKDCDGVADASIGLVQNVIDEIEAMSPEEVGALAQGQSTPAFDALAVQGGQIGARSQELECTDLDALVKARADQLTNDPANGFTQLIVDGVKSGEDVMGRLFR